MKERWEELQMVMEEMKTMKTKEFILTLAVCVLSGLVIGMLISPKKRVMMGCNNGNNNVSGPAGAKAADGKEAEAGKQ